jgi:anti-anti-sigma factor
VRALRNISFDTSAYDGGVRVAVCGELDLATRALFQAFVLQLKEQQPVVCLDLSGLEFMDVAGLHGLERIVRDFEKQGRVEVDAHVQPQVQQILVLTNTKQLLWPTRGVFRGLRPHSPDVPDDPDGPGSPGLSTAQLRFAKRHGATAGANSALLDAICGDGGTERWLVNRKGQVLDHALLR